jgi:UDP-glucose 4-epimerase
LRSLVTGGAGFIGSHLVDALVARGDDVVVLDNLRRARRLPPPGVEFIQGDVRDQACVARAVVGCELVFHLAAQSNVLGAMSDVEYSFSTNVVGTFNVLAAASAAGVGRLVFSSSREVYGEATLLPVPETAPLAAKNPYGASKVAGEAYCRVWESLGDMRVAVLRFANVYGARDAGRVIPLWIERARDRLPLQVFGGDQVLDLVPVRTCVDALLSSAERMPGTPVNVGSGMGTPILALAERVLAVAGHRGGIDRQPARSAEVVRFVADVTRMRTLLGIEPPPDPLCDLPDTWRALAGQGFGASAAG